MTRPVELHLEPGSARRITVAGRDIAHLVADVHVTHRAGGLPVVTLQLVALQAAVRGDARVELGAGDRAVLVELGWTPPQEET